MTNQTYREIFDRAQSIMKESGEPIQTGNYGTAKYGKALYIKADIYTPALKKFLEEFDMCFIASEKGLVVG